MTQKKYFLITIIFLMLLITMTGCTNNEIELPPNNDVIFQAGRHLRDDVYYRQFNTYYTLSDNIEFHIREDIYDEATAKTLYNTFLTDYNTAQSFLFVDTEIKVYIVEGTITGEVFVNQNKLYCTIENINEKSYLTGLVAAYFNIVEPWKIEGASQYIFGNDIDVSSLVSYYNDEDNLHTLSLFAGYFNNAFSDDNTIDVAKLTAMSFSRFLLDQYDIETFLSCSFTASYRQEWLNSISVDKDYVMDYDMSWLNGAIYSQSEKYPFIITTDNRVYNLSPITQGTDLLETPLSIIKCLSDYQIGMSNILSYIEETAPINYPQILSIWQSKIRYYFDEDLIISHAKITENGIYIKYPRYLFHETIHILVPPSSGTKELWKAEGIAEYLSFFDGTVNDLENRAYMSITLDSEQFAGDNRIFFESVKEYYLSNESYPHGTNDINFSLYYESIAYVTLTQPQLQITISEIASMSIAERIFNLSGKRFFEYHGNNLTYPEACFFIKYLISNYGLDEVISFCISPDTVDVFLNITYENAFEDFMTSLEND